MFSSSDVAESEEKKHFNQTFLIDQRILEQIKSSCKYKVLMGKKKKNNKKLKS